ncbi:sporulation protein YdfR [Bacillus spizizenii TU-B-10]|uniref:Sporulation protein YdfR n=2 Tax=Bacillus spizizenii TaxID=96241 RepID=G4NYH8_BACS4|nr:sporulation protein YdfR [Bacillus spizizenii TU-B-10]
MEKSTQKGDCMNFAWEALILIISGIILLRISGRKSISQMTLAQTVVMISIGTIIVQPIIETSLWKTLVAASIFTVALILMEWFQIKANWMEKFITGKAKLVIEDGKLNIENMKKLRLTVDQLEMRMRLHGISSIKDVKNATIEANGQLGYELRDDKKPLTMGDFKKMMNVPDANTMNRPEPDKQDNIFEELKNSSHSASQLK